MLGLAVMYMQNIVRGPVGFHYGYYGVMGHACPGPVHTLNNEVINTIIFINYLQCFKHLIS